MDFTIKQLKAINNNWTATALLFSGRPNFEWALIASQQKNWMQLWEDAALSDTAVKQPSVLGYTGCRLQYDEHSHWYLYNGCVSFYEEGKTVSKKDDERKMELFLLGTAPEEVKGFLREMKII
jgi:hypothetical protein